MKNFWIRVLDIILSTGALILWSPVMLIICLVLLIFNGPGPIIYKRRSIGKNGKIFWLYKFRTMNHAAENGSPWEKELNRITPCGRILRKFSLDELPQLINIIKGDMHFIGLNALKPSEAALYGDEDKNWRFVDKPGLTGPVQLTSGNDLLSFDKRKEIEYNYTIKKNFWFDLKLFGRTWWYIFGGKNK